MDEKHEKETVSDAQATTPASYISYLNPLHFRKRGKRGKAFIALGMVCFFWGTTWLASKEGVRHMPALQLAGMRQLIGGTCYVIFFLAKGATWPKGKEWFPILVLSCLNFFLSNGLSTWGVKYISAGLGSIIGAIFPLWLVVIGLFAQKSRMKPKAIAAIQVIGRTLVISSRIVRFCQSHMHFDFRLERQSFDLALGE